jgi:hypothetical protein
MAITRSQQAKQLLANGGRIGFFKGAQADTKKGSPMSPGTSVGGNTRGGTGKGRDRDFQQRGVSEREYNRRVAEGTQGSFRGSDDPPKPPQLQKDKRFIPTPVPKGIGFLERNRNKLIQSSLNRNKYLALKKLGLIKDPGFTGFIGTTINALTGKIPEQFELMSEEDLLNIATSGPYLSQQKTKGDVNKFSSGKDLLGRVFEAEDLLRKGDMTQTKFEELFPGPDIPDDRDGSDQVMDPCKGPNPPAYCFIGEKADETQEAAITRNLAGLTPRIGGSIFNFDNMADGGIAGMDREAFLLGGIAKGLKKAVRGVKKLVKSPIGKAALLGAVGFGIPGTQFGGIFGKGAFSKFIGQKAMTQAPFAKGTGLKGILESALGFAKANPFETIGGISALSAFMTPKEDENNDELAKYLAQNQLNPNAPLNKRILGSDFYQVAADGGRIGYQEGGDAEPVAKKTMPLLDMDGKEKDYRETGGFVDMGRMERADDVPARLSKNEFVFTADAVRNAGEGDIDKGAEVMYNMMKNLEAGGEVSEESQGLEGARKMFQTSQRLGEVI